MSKDILKLVIPEPGTGVAPPPCTNEDPELFFPDSEAEHNQLQIKQAKAVCRKCPMKFACLEFALETDDKWAILGGTTPSERSALQARRDKQKSRSEKRKYQKWDVAAA